MQDEEDQELFYQIPLKRLVAWNKWWYIISGTLLIAFQKRYWGLLGHYLQKVKGVENPHLSQVRLTFGKGQGRLLPQLSKFAPK